VSPGGIRVIAARIPVVACRVSSGAGQRLLAAAGRSTNPEWVSRWLLNRLNQFPDVTELTASPQSCAAVERAGWVPAGGVLSRVGS
jgi:hypothetical protein